MAPTLPPLSDAGGGSALGSGAAAVHSADSGGYAPLLLAALIGALFSVVLMSLLLAVARCAGCERLVLFGDRSATWATEAEQSAFAGLEPPFATIHKTTQHVLLEERDRDAAPRPRLRRTAAQVLQLVERRVQRIVTLRWQAALEAHPSDGGDKCGRCERE